MFEAGEFDVCRSSINVQVGHDADRDAQQTHPGHAPMRWRPKRPIWAARSTIMSPTRKILDDLLPRNLGVQVYRACWKTPRPNRLPDDRDGQCHAQRWRHDRR